MLMTDSVQDPISIQPQVQVSASLSDLIGIGYGNVFNSLSILFQDIDKTGNSNISTETDTTNKNKEPQKNETIKGSELFKNIPKVKALDDICPQAPNLQQNKIITTPLQSQQIKQPISKKQPNKIDNFFDENIKIPTVPLKQINPQIDIDEQKNSSKQHNQNSQRANNLTPIPEQQKLYSQSISPRYFQQSRNSNNNKKQTIDNEFIDEQQNKQSIDKDFQEYVNRQFNNQTQEQEKKQSFRYSSRKHLIDFEPMIMITEISGGTPSKSRMSRRSKYRRRKQSVTEVNSLGKNQWSSDMIKLKQAKRRRRVLEQQLMDVKTEIDILENPEKIISRPKIKQMIKIADDSDANLRAINFVKRMNNERKIKQQRFRMIQQKQTEEMIQRMDDIEKMGEHYLEKRKIKKIEDISQRIQDYQIKKQMDRKLKSINSIFIEKVKKKVEDVTLPELEKKKSDLKRIRNLSSGNPHSIIEQYNKDIYMK